MIYATSPNRKSMIKTSGFYLPLAIVLTGMRYLLKSLMIILVFAVCPLYSFEVSETFTGIASWYAGEFQGRLTANGEIFDTDRVSAAHKELPFGTVVRVTHGENGRSVDVRINDRGPYVDGRIIDLSRAAADAIGMVDEGIAEVHLQLLYVPDTPESAYRRAEDADHVRMQVGAFSDVKRVLELYLQLAAAGFSPYAEVTGSGLLRLSVRWIEQEASEREASRLRVLGFSDLLIRADELN